MVHDPTVTRYGSIKTQNGTFWKLFSLI